MSTRITAFANQKGGVGKTTTAVNMAAGIAQAGKRVLLIDLDPQANATSGLGLEKIEGVSMYPALLGDRTVESLISSTSIDTLDLVPAEVDLAGAEIEVARLDNYLHAFTDAIQPIRNSGRYDYILIDCPPSLGILTMNALTAADSMIIPIQCEYYALEGLTTITRIVDQLNANGTNRDLSIEGIVMTMYDMRTNLSKQVVQEVYDHFGATVYQTLIPRSVRISEAPSHGLPISSYDPGSTGARAYTELAQEFIDRCEARSQAADSPAPPMPPMA